MVMKADKSENPGDNLYIVLRLRSLAIQGVGVRESAS